MKAHQNAVARRQYFRDVEGPDKQDLHVFITEDMNSHGAGYGWVFYFGDGTGERRGRRLDRVAFAYGPQPQGLLRPLSRGAADWRTGCENATPEGPPKSWSLKMGMWGAKRYGQGADGGRGCGEHGPPHKRRRRRLRDGVGPPGRLLGPRGARQERFLRPRFSRDTSASSGTSGPASTSRATRSSTSCQT